MLPRARFSILGILIDSIDYSAAVGQIIQAAQDRRRFSVSALAVHGVMTGVFDAEHKFRLNQFDLLVPDGQPVRWALNLLHGAGLRDRVYGPKLMLELCRRAAAENLSIYLYGSTPEVSARLGDNLRRRFPKLLIAGTRPSAFRRLSLEEREQVTREIRRSGAALVFVGLGCPRQEVWAYEFRKALNVPIISVGAAFSFHAGAIRQAPPWMQQAGLEWLFRWWAEPRRLWRRYLFLNPAYVFLIALQATDVAHFATDGRIPIQEELYG